MVAAVVGESNRAPGAESTESEDELERELEAALADGEGGQQAGSSSQGGALAEDRGELERELNDEHEGGDGAGPSRDGGGVSLEDVQRMLMEDSDDAEADGGVEDAVERQDSGNGGAGGVSSGGDGLSDYEKERQANILRNQAHLKQLGLDGPSGPPRPSPAPRQPRPSRPPGVPSRASDRQRGNAKSYSERQVDEDFEAQLASDSEDESVVDDGEPAPPRRSSRVPGREGSVAAFNEQTRSAIKETLWNARATSDLEGVGLEVVTFISATQLPRDRINSVGVTGDADELDRHSESLHISISLRIRNFLSNVLRYPAQLLWRWIAWLPGLDVTALLYRGDVIGATVGYYWTEEHAYLTHLSAVHRELQGVGVGLFLRRWQLHQLTQRIGSGPGPLEVVSLSESSNGAVQFQRRVLSSLGFDEVPRAESVIRRLAAARPELELERVLQQDVTPLRFRKVTSLRGV